MEGREVRRDGGEGGKEGSRREEGVRGRTGEGFRGRKKVGCVWPSFSIKEKQLQ